MPNADKTLAKTSLVDIVDVRKSFGPTEVLKGVSINIGRGDVVAIIGGSGSSPQSTAASLRVSRLARSRPSTKA